MLLEDWPLLMLAQGVPGAVAASLRHLGSLRRMQRDHGWIHTLLEEAENERMHLLVAVYACVHCFVIWLFQHCFCYQKAAEAWCVHALLRADGSGRLVELLFRFGGLHSLLCEISILPAQYIISPRFAHRMVGYLVCTYEMLSLLNQIVPVCAGGRGHAHVHAAAG